VYDLHVAAAIEEEGFRVHYRFRAHLRGRIAFVRQVHEARGLKLQSLFEKIAW
jgi:hypothetical protein